MRHCARSQSPKQCDSCTLFHCTSLIPNFTLPLQINFSSLPLFLIRHFLPSRPLPALLLSHPAGEACAKKFAAEGCKVVVSDLDPVKSDKVAADINAAVGAGAAISGACARNACLRA
jgi:hypothetical protein